MSLVSVSGAERSHPIAYLDNDHDRQVVLGTRIVPVIGRLNYPVDMELAEAEMAPVLSHRAVELTLALFATELANEKPEHHTSVAMAAIITNYHLPDEIQHLHPELWGVIDVPNTRTEIVMAHDQADEALAWISKMIMVDPSRYGESLDQELQFALHRFHDMLSFDGINFNARNWRVKKGILQHK